MAALIERLDWDGTGHEEVASFFAQGRQRYSVDGDHLVLYCACRDSTKHALPVAPGGVVRYDGNRYWRQAAVVEP